MLKMLSLYSFQLRHNMLIIAVSMLCCFHSQGLIASMASNLYGTLLSSQISSTDNLPVLGDQISAIISPEEEYWLGRAWLRSLRAQASLIHDPLLHEYLEDLIYRLASYSEIEQPNIEMVIVNSEAINAFAVPGGVIGINAGLILHAETEDETSAVLAHELAHLSQRHFARNAEEARRNQWTSLASLLASVAILATAGGDSGIAALATTQAFAIQNRLRFSRENEREADRIGMLTLSRAGLDPHAMPSFFEKLYNSSRFSGDLPPEFLLTHPVTQTRIADSLNRAAKYPPPSAIKPQALEYQLMRARVMAAYSKDSTANIKRFELALSEPNKGEANHLSSQAHRYGLVRALLKANRYREAHGALKPLREQDPTRITYVVTEAEILMAQQKYKKAAKLLEKHLQFSPNNYSLSIYYAQNLLRIGEYKKALPILEVQLERRPNNIYLWRLLSEAEGAAGNITAVHLARAEVFLLHNRTERAIDQLRYALRLAEDNFQLSSKIKFRIKEIKQYQRDLRIN